MRKPTSIAITHACGPVSSLDRPDFQLVAARQQRLPVTGWMIQFWKQPIRRSRVRLSRRRRCRCVTRRTRRGAGVKARRRRFGRWGWPLAGLGLVLALAAHGAGTKGAAATQTFAVRGVVRELGAGNRTLMVSHEAIPGYMSAMTMPFNVKRPEELNALRPGDRIAFQLHVTESRSWIDAISRLGTAPMPADTPSGAVAPAASADAGRKRHPLLDFKFTNELGQAVSLSDFRGQALAITFFFTRCPLPEFCPRLSRNFQEASEKLELTPGAPTNWHFLSITFDPEVDTPAVLKVYGERYHYDAARWSFLTGPPEQIRELARLSGVEVEREGGLLNHNFRTLIVDATGHLQTTFPFGGDLSEAIVGEMLKAMAATNAPRAAVRAAAAMAAGGRNP